MKKVFDLIFLEGEMPLTKKYELVDGAIQKTPYPNAFLFTSHHEPVADLKDFAAHIKSHAAAGHCLLKGVIHNPLINERRAGSTSSDDHTHWVCLDFDGLPDKHSLDALLKMLGLHDISYVLQWSASYKIPLNSTSLRCHVFMLLDKPTTPSHLREWLMHLNLDTPFLRENTSLTHSHMSLRWPLDVTACQNDKLLYIAEPNLIGIPNPFPKGKSRVSIVTKKNQYLQLKNPDTSARIQQQMRVDELRVAKNLPARKASYKSVEGATSRVLSNPEEITIYETKVERGFTYFNFNGGDSWGYFHPAENAEVIYNFKGEDPCLTKVLLPDYYDAAKKKAKAVAKEYAAEHNTGVHISTTKAGTPAVMLAFQDKHGVYWVGSYTEATDTLVLNRKKSEKQVRDFCAQNAIPMGDFIPEWQIVFDPQSTTRVDPSNYTINMYQPSVYMTTPFKKVNACPPVILKVIHHALGSEPEVTDHFINWLAFIVQRQERSGTAWVLHGTEGTGKGLLYSQILKPLLGPPQTNMARVEEMLKGFNGFVKNKLLVAFDEVHIGVMKEQDEILGRLRNMITEEAIQIRDLYASPELVPNLTNYLFFSNKRDSVLINTNDRRYNVGRYQSQKLEVVHKEFAKSRETNQALIANELQAFAFFLRGYPVSPEAARAPLETADRANMMAITTPAPDKIAGYLSLEGANMQELIDMMDRDEKRVQHAKREAMKDFKQVLVDNMLRTMDRMNHPKSKVAIDTNGVMSRDEARTIFEFGLGQMKDGPTRFTQFLRHRHLEPTRVWIDNKAVTGLRMNWQDVDKFPEYLQELGYKQKA
jgi:Family of unknown function (DUF5906)